MGIHKDFSKIADDGESREDYKGLRSRIALQVREDIKHDLELIAKATRNEELIRIINNYFA